MKKIYFFTGKALPVFCLLLISFTSVFGAARTWTGNTSNDWSLAANWSGGLPGSGDDVTIPTSPSGGRMPVISSGNFQIKSLTIQSGATLTQSGGTLLVSGANSSVAGTLSLSAGTLLSGNNFTIEDGGVMNISGSALLHMATSTGSNPSDAITVDINGVLNLSGGTINVKDITTNSGSPDGKIMQSGGVFHLYHDFKNKGEYVATGGTIQFTGSAGGASFPVDVQSSNTQFYNVLIDPAAVPKFGTNAATSFNVAGNWTNNSSAVDLDNKANTTIFNGSGAQVIGGTESTTFRNIVVNKPTGTLTLSANQSINNGNLTISSGTLDLDGYTLNRVSSGGVFTISSGALFKLGNNSGGQSGSNFPVNFTSYTFDNASNVDYDATTTQTIYHGVTYGNLTLSNGPKTAGGQIVVNGTLSLNAAILTTTATNLLVLNDNATVTGAAYNAYVNGPVKKIGNDAFTFPVGKSGVGYMYIAISAPSSVTDAFTAEYMRSSGQNLGAITAAGLKRVSNCDYWNLNRVSGTSSVNVTLSWNGYSNCNIAAYINDLSSLSVAHFNGTNWDTHGQSGYTGTASSGTVTRNNVSVFSPFAIGSTNEYSNPLSIQFNTNYSLPVTTSTAVYNLYPVPAQKAGKITVEHNKLPRGNYEISIYSITGGELKHLSIMHTGGIFKQAIEIPATLSEGVYNIRLEQDGLTLMSKRFVLN
jgi:hypothetical protein